MRLNLILGLFFCFLALTAEASEVSFNSANSSVIGSVRYTLIGKYSARFKSFEGTITLDETGKLIQSVTLNIDAASVHSNSPALDNIVRSPTLLDTKKFSAITFQSTSIERLPAGYKVKGTLSLHGVARQVEFPFTADEMSVVQGKTTIRARGTWPITRKDFGVTWNKYLDHGGIIVGNVIMVEWLVTAENTI